MARLTWEQVAAPELDLRGLAQAGQTIVGGFDRLALMLQQRAELKKKEATDAAIAGQLLLTDPTQVGKIDLASLDPNVDKRALLEASVDYRRDLTQELSSREDLLNKQAAVKFGAEHVDILEGAWKGDDAAKAKIAALSAEDPEFARAMAQWAPDIFDAMSKGYDFREDKRVHDANIADQAIGRSLERQRIGQSAAELALRRDALNFEKTGKKDVIEGADFGQRMATQLGAMTPAQAEAELLKDKAFNEGSPAFQEAARKVFTSRQPVLSTDTLDKLSTAGGSYGGPEVATLRQINEVSKKIAPELNANEFYTQLQDAGPYWTVGTAKAHVEKIKSSVPGATTADVAAAVQVNGISAGLFDLFDGEKSRLEQTVRAMVNQRNMDQVNGQLLLTQQQILGYTSTGKPVPDYLKNRLNNLLEKSKPK